MNRRDCQPLANFGPWIIKGLSSRVAALEGGAESPSPSRPKKRATKPRASDDGADDAPRPRGRPKKVQDSAATASSSQSSGPVKIPRAVPKNSSGVKSLGWDPYSVETSNTIHHNPRPEPVSRIKSASTPSVRAVAQPVQPAQVQYPGQFDFWYIGTHYLMALFSK